MPAVACGVALPEAALPIGHGIASYTLVRRLIESLINYYMTEGLLRKDIMFCGQGVGERLIVEAIRAPPAGSGNAPDRFAGEEHLQVVLQVSLHTHPSIDGVILVRAA